MRWLLVVDASEDIFALQKFYQRLKSQFIQRLEVVWIAASDEVDEVVVINIDADSIVELYGII